MSIVFGLVKLPFYKAEESYSKQANIYTYKHIYFYVYYYIYTYTRLQIVINAKKERKQ